jgi:hypothetical protein
VLQQTQDRCATGNHRDFMERRARAAESACCLWLCPPGDVTCIATLHSSGRWYRTYDVVVLPDLRMCSLSW